MTSYNTDSYENKAVESTELPYGGAKRREKPEKAPSVVPLDEIMKKVEKVVKK